VPLGALLLLSGLLIAPALASGDAQVGHRRARRHGARLRIRSEISDENDLVDATRHGANPRAVGTVGRRRPCLPDKLRMLEEANAGREREFAARCARKTPSATLATGTDIAPRPGQARMIRTLDDAEIARVLTYERLIPAMERALMAFSRGEVTQPVRNIIPVE